MTDLPIIMTKAGLQPQAPIDLRAQLVALVLAAGNVGYTSNLPGSLIEDIASTDIFAISLCDQAKVELVNSLTPYGANPFILNQLGVLYGIEQSSEQNGSVYVTFTGSVGFVIQRGFLVSDGSRQYIIQDGGIISAGGTSRPLYAVSTTSGTFAIPIYSVNQLASSVPVGITLSVTNLEPGTPGGIAQTLDQYRSVVLGGIKAAAQGMPSYLKTLLRQIPGVQDRLVSMRTVSGGYQILCGGGDPYQVANAIYNGASDIALLQGSAIDSARTITTTIVDSPDTYNILFVNPVNQVVSVQLTWNTTDPNFVSNDAVAEQGSAALQVYVNGVVVGQPMILYQMQRAFSDAIAAMIPPEYLIKINIAVQINGSSAPPVSGTGEIVGDAEGFFTLTSANTEILRG